MMNNNEIILTDLQKANLQNLQWLEGYSLNKPELNMFGMVILRCFTYDLIQLFNNAYLQDLSNEFTEST